MNEADAAEYARRLAEARGEPMLVGTWSALDTCWVVPATPARVRILLELGAEARLIVTPRGEATIPDECAHVVK